MITKEILLSHLDYLVARTARGDALVRTDPRQLPRRLRVLLLAIDGGQTVQLYTQMLKGFGDVVELLVELMALGLIELVDAREKLRQTPAVSHYAALDLLLDDSRFDSGHAAEQLYGATAAGSFDEMLRVARIEAPQFVPRRTAAPAPISPQAQKAQLESAFKLLDATRGERIKLKHQLAKMERIRQIGVRLEKNNQQLTKYVYVLGSVCAALFVFIGLFLLRR